MTTQPTAGAVQTKGVGYSAINLATTAGAQQWLGGVYPAAGVLARRPAGSTRHKDTVQKVVDALVATMHWIHTHTAAADRRRDAAGVCQQRPHDEGDLRRGARRRTRVSSCPTG